MITQETKIAMQGVIPANLVTCSSDGNPNITFISQLYYVDDNHVALSHQFFNKTSRNIRENPHACVSVHSPEDFSHWVLNLNYSHSESEGDTFDQMSMQLDAIASMSGMEDVFSLKAAEIFEVISIEKLS